MSAVRSAAGGLRGFARRHPQRLSLLVGAAAAVLAGIGWLLDPAAFFAAWLVGFLVWTGLALGSLGLLMLGHLLGDPWLEPVRQELEAGARTLPLLGLLGVPLLFGLPELYVWARPGMGGEPLPAARVAYLAPGVFMLRYGVYFVVWSLLAWRIARPGHHRWASAFGLILLLPTVSYAATDWIMSLEPDWLSSLFGLAFAASQLVAALAAAILIALVRPDREPEERLDVLAAALFWLALLAAYLWFAEFLIVWQANLPHEVSWFIARSEGWWRWLKVFGVAGATGLAILLLLPRQVRRVRVTAAAVLLLAQHPAHLFWQVRPVAGTGPLHWLDPLATLAIGALCAAVFFGGLHRHRAAAEGQGAAAAPRASASPS